ncbi:E3 ubiquitin-protein ligase NEDD4-like [Bienertia sinuspersici]
MLIVDVYRDGAMRKPFKPGYSAPPPLFQYGHIRINFRGNWQISRRELTQSQLMVTPVSTDHAFLNSDPEEPSSRTFICRVTVAVIFIGLLILRHTLPILNGGSDEFVLLLFILAVLRVAGILLLVYVTIKAISGLRSQRNQDETSNVPETISEVEENERLDSQQLSHVIQIS